MMVNHNQEQLTWCILWSLLRSGDESPPVSEIQDEKEKQGEGNSIDERDDLNLNQAEGKNQNGRLTTPISSSSTSKEPTENHTTNDTESQTPQEQPLSTAHSIALVSILTCAGLLTTVSVQITIIILPTIGNALSILAPRQQWIVSAYSLAFGCLLLAWGRIADVYGKRKIFLLGSAWLALVTLIAPFIPSEIGFDVFRALQGVGAAANVPTAISILGTTLQPGKAKTYAFAVYAAGAPLGGILGLLLGGVIGEYAKWEWCFWTLSIMAALITVTGYLVIPIDEKRAERAGLRNSVDWVGAFIVTTELLVLLFALTQGNIDGWGTAWIPVLIVIGALLTTMFVLWQLYLKKRTSRRPLIKMTIFKKLQIAAAAGVMALYFAAFNTFMILATFYFQDYKGLDPIHTTIHLLPLGVAGFLTVAVVAQLLARIDVNYLLISGTFCGAIASLLFALPISSSTTYWAYAFPALVLSVIGADTVTPALLLFTAKSLPKEDQALGAGMINAVREIGRAIGLAIATAIQFAVQGDGRMFDADKGSAVHSPSLLAGLRAAHWFDFGLCLVACFVAAIAFRGAGKVGAK